MSDAASDSARPAKRARLDDTAAPSLSTSTSTPAQAQPVAPAPTPIDADLEREVRAGITEYVCPDNLGFTGVLKQRYTDFLVNEIALDGVVVHLKSTEVEKKRQVEKRVNGEAKKDGGEKQGKTEIREEKGQVEVKVLQSGEEVVKEGEEKKEGAEQKEGTEEKKESNGDGEVKAQEEEVCFLGDCELLTRTDLLQISNEDRNTLHSIFGEDTSALIITLARQVRRREHKKAKDFKAVVAPPIADKEQRTQAHKCLRRIFPNLLESSMEEDQSIRIKATPPADRKGKGKGKGRDQRDPDAGRRNGQMRWEELGGDYLHFTLYKENKDTMEIVGFLGSKLNCGSKGFGFAGTKDRRACTAQRVCVRRQTAERMQGFNRHLFNAAIGDFEYRNNELKLGDLKGNEFTITLRDCHFESENDLDISQRVKLANEVVSKAISDFSEKGFINYYGLQRFGSFAASTDAIGRKMLQDDLKGAVEDLLAYSDVALAAAEGTDVDSPILVSQDDRNRAQALHLWKTTGAGNTALDLLPRKFTAERNIIQHLSSRNSKNGRRDRQTDYQGALMTIPRNLRLMYVHAYQSLVWNIVAGHRWAQHGATVIPGDLVLVHEHLDKQTRNSSSDITAMQSTTDQNGEPIINPSGSENANAASLDFERARPLSAAEAASGHYTIWDIVLPQPGFDVEYPPNAIGAFYTTFMSSEKGGGLDPLNMRRAWREVSLSGGYRKVMARPLGELGVEVRRYMGVEEQFVETDFQRLGVGRGLGSQQSGGKVGGGGGGSANQDGNGKVEEDVTMGDAEQQQGEEKIAVVLRLQLASSQYATMALRELMKAGGVKAYKPEYMGGR